MNKRKEIDDTDKILTVIQSRSITSAAKILGISQSSLSRFLQSFEEDLGVSVFKRTSEGITLTESGEICAKYLWQMKKAGEDLQRRLDYLVEPIHNLNIAVPLNIGKKDTERMLKKIREKYPYNTLQL